MPLPKVFINVAVVILRTRGSGEITGLNSALIRDIGRTYKQRTESPTRLTAPEGEWEKALPKGAATHWMAC